MSAVRPDTDAIHKGYGPAGGQDEALAQLSAELLTHQTELQQQSAELLLRSEAAELAKQQYQVLFDSLPLPALVVDEQGQVLQRNALFNTWFGEGGHSTVRLRHAMGRMEWRAVLGALRDASHQGSAQLTNLRVLDTGDRVRFVDLIVSHMPVGFHLDPRFSILLMDRTAEAEREADRRLFESLLNGTDDLVYAADTNGRMMLANRAFTEKLGHAGGQITGRTRSSFMPLRDAMLQEARDAAVLSSGQTSIEEETLSCAGDGRRLHLLSHRFALRDAEQRVVGVGGILRDTTAEFDLRKQNVLSEAVFVNATEAIIVTDALTRIQRVNPSFERLVGFTADAVRGQRTTLLRSRTHTPSFYRELWQRLHDQGHWEGEINLRRASGADRTAWAHLVALRDNRKQITGYMAMLADMTQLKHAQNLLERMASFDTLTNLPNRKLLMDRLDKLLALATRQVQPFAVLFCDLDHFKEVNDSLGHHVGDQLLSTLAERMAGTVRSQDTVARLGGDEFVLLLPGADRQAAAQLAKKLQDRIAEPIELPGIPAYRAETSFGVAVFPDDGCSADLLIRNADTAMYAAKTSGRGRVETYSETMGQATARSFDMTNALKRAIGNRELSLFIQPKFRLSDRVMQGGEALIRWQRPGVGTLSPAEFLPVAERAGLMVAIDRWVLGDSVRLLHNWRAKGLWPTGWRLAVNQTSTDMAQPGYAEHLLDLCQAVGVPPACLEIEINEGILVQPSPTMLSTLRALCDMGVTLSIDDFGTGYSSLAYLKQLPIHAIKIDQAFVRDMLVDDNDRTLVEAVVTLGQKMGHELVAEGIETEGQFQLLHNLGCQYGQGYLMCRPMPEDAFQRLLDGPRH